MSNKYVEESKRQILLVSNIPPEEVEKLVYLALSDYKAQMREYRRLIEMEYGSTNKDGKDYPLIKDDVQLLIDVSKTLAISAMDGYAQTLERAKEQDIQNDFVRTTQDRMMRIAVELTDLYDVYHDSAQVWQAYYKTRFDSTENYNYDDAFLCYQDLSFSFTDYQREILDHAFQFKEQYAISNLWANKVLAKLVAVDPATYAGAVERDKVIIESDESWLVSKTYQQGYNKPEFDDSGWKHAGVVASKYNQFIELGIDPKPIWLPSKKVLPDTSRMTAPADSGIGMAADSLVLQDSLGLAVSDSSGQEMMAPEAADMAMTEEMETDSTGSDTTQVFFRKKIDLKGTPVEGVMYITADNDYNFFLNGEYITDDVDNNFAIVDTIDYGYLSYSIKPGENTLALRVIDTDNTHGGVKIYGVIELIPLDILASMEARSKVAELNIDPAILHRLNTLNKNRIYVKQ